MLILSVVRAAQLQIVVAFCGRPRHPSQPAMTAASVFSVERGVFRESRIQRTKGFAPASVLEIVVRSKAACEVHKLREDVGVACTVRKENPAADGSSVEPLPG